MKNKKQTQKYNNNNSYETPEILEKLEHWGIDVKRLHKYDSSGDEIEKKMNEWERLVRWR